MNIVPHIHHGSHCFFEEPRNKRINQSEHPSSFFQLAHFSFAKLAVLSTVHFCLVLPNVFSDCERNKICSDSRKYSKPLVDVLYAAFWNFISLANCLLFAVKLLHAFSHWFQISPTLITTLVFPYNGNEFPKCFMCFREIIRDCMWHF